MSSFRGTTRRLRVPSAIASAIVVASCSIGAVSAQASPKSESSSGTAKSTGDVAAALKQIGEYEGIPKFVAPNAPFKVSSLKGKTVDLIGIDLTTPALNYAISGAQQAAKTAGIHTTVFNGKTSPSLWVEGVEQAISSHAGAIALVGVPAGAVSSELKTAKADGIPVVTIENNQPNASAPGQGAGADIYAASAENFELEAELAADAAIVQTNGHARALIMNTPTITPSPSIDVGFKAALSKCSGCSVVAETTIEIETWGPKLTTLTTAALRAHPTANVLLVEFDTMALFIVPAVVSAGDTGKVTVESTSGFPSAATVMTKDPKVLIALAGQSDYWAGWLSMNQMMRGMLHLKPGNPVVPTRYITPSLVKKVGTSEAALYGDAFEKGFEKLWGLG